MKGKSARSLPLFSLSTPLSANYRYSSNGRDRSIYKPQRSRPHVLPWITTHIIPHRPPFSRTLVLTKERQRLPSSIASRNSTLSRFLLALPFSFRFPSVFLRLSLRRTHQAHSRAICTNDETTTVKACRAASHDFQHGAIPGQVVSRRGIMRHTGDFWEG